MNLSKRIITSFLVFLSISTGYHVIGQQVNNYHQLTDTVEIAVARENNNKSLPKNTLDPSYLNLGNVSFDADAKVWLNPQRSIALIQDYYSPQFYVRFFNLMVNLADVKLYTDKGSVAFHEKKYNLFKGSHIKVPYDQFPEGKYVLVIKTGTGETLKQKLFIPDTGYQLDI